MSRKPSARLFNKTVTIQRPSSSTSNYYDSGEPTSITTTAKARIDVNRWFGVAKVKDQGFTSQSSHRGWILYDSDYSINQGDYLIDGSDKYRINYSDPAPGGVLESHYELWMSKV